MICNVEQALENEELRQALAKHCGRLIPGVGIDGYRGCPPRTGLVRRVNLHMKTMFCEQPMCGCSLWCYTAACLQRAARTL
ncbi:MAG: hypothetical protein ACO2PN_15375 [Pyrobaculum sp.]